MSDRPILFSAPMVKALLAGTKTQTRRLAGVPVIEPMKGPAAEGEWYDIHARGGGVLGVAAEDVPSYAADYLPIQPGDRLWVKETWRTGGQFDHLAPRDLIRQHAEPIAYCADEPPGHILRTGKARPSIFMLRWASRLTLHVTDVRVQRLQDITTMDAKDEGIPEFWDQADRLGLPNAAEDNGHVWDNRTTVENYRTLWNHINGAGSWDANPWVAAYTFTVEQANIDQARAAA